MTDDIRRRMVAAISPAADTATIEAVLKLLDTGVITAGDEMPQHDEPPAPPGLPGVADGEEVVQVAKAIRKTWEDSGEVLTLWLTRGDGSELKVRFDEKRAKNWLAAAEALGIDPKADDASLVGLEAVVTVVMWAPDDGDERPVVRRWKARAGAPRAAAKAAKKSAKATPAKPSRNATVIHGEVADDEIPF
jgi:hypothetical protein